MTSLGYRPSKVRVAFGTSPVAVSKVFWPVHVVRHEVGNRVLEWGLPVTAFAFEHCAAAYPGLACIFDLALGLPDPFAIKWFIVAPDAREDSIRNRLRIAIVPSSIRCECALPALSPTAQIAPGRLAAGRRACSGKR